jgi:cytochrome c biogenesis protein CcdA
MGDLDIPENFGSKLLQQDESLHSERYKEHRMQLEHQLIKAESHERLTKRAVVGAMLTLAVVFPILASGVFGSADPFDEDATVLSIALGVIYVLACAMFFIGIASYYSRFLPRLRRVREELRDETIRDLRREIADLRRLIEGQSKARDTDQRGPE